MPSEEVELPALGKLYTWNPGISYSGWVRKTRLVEPGVYNVSFNDKDESGFLVSGVDWLLLFDIQKHVVSSGKPEYWFFYVYQSGIWCQNGLRAPFRSMITQEEYFLVCGKQDS